MTQETFLGQIRIDGVWMDYARGTEAASRHWVEQDTASRRVVDWIYKDRILMGAGAPVRPVVTAKSEGRTYLLGLPVTVTVHDDGTVDVMVYLEDGSEAIRDEAGVQYGDEDSVAALTMETVEADAVLFEQTYAAEKTEPIGRSVDRLTVDWS